MIGRARRGSTYGNSRGLDPPCPSTGTRNAASKYEINGLSKWILMLFIACQSSLGVFFPLFALPGPIDQPVLGDVGTGSGVTSGPGQFNGELDNAALTGNLVAANPPRGRRSLLVFNQSHHGSSPWCSCRAL